MSQLFQNKYELRTYLEENLKENSSLGFVPTMGALHDGHLSLIKTAFSLNDWVVVSIFVNPTQFNNPEDLKKYPRDLNQDIAKIESCCPNCIIYAPTIEDVYDNVKDIEHFDFGGIELQLEGKFRPGHFDGVGTVVKRLFEIVKPHNAYFGEKDFQQYLIIKKLVELLSLKINVICCPIEREANGLAMSSRNERLSPPEREQAGLIYELLKFAKENFSKISQEEIQKIVKERFENEKNIKLEYFEITNEKTLTHCISKENNIKFRAFIAVFVNNVRLIDTISLN